MEAVFIKHRNRVIKIGEKNKLGIMEEQERLYGVDLQVEI
jgi:hypothetical protein